MNFFVLNDDVKSIIAKHLQSDCTIRITISSIIMIFKKYYLERLCLMMIFIKLQNYRMMILKMQKYTRFIKISMTLYILVVHVVVHVVLEKTNDDFKKKNCFLLYILVVHVAVHVVLWYFKEFHVKI